MHFRFSLAFVLCASAVCAPRPAVPSTKEIPVKDILHGHEIVDPYRWLEDQNSPETRAWIDAQMKVTRKFLDGIPALPAFRERLASLMKVEAMTPPVVREGRYFFTRRRADQSRASIWMRKGFDGEDRLLVDPAAFGSDESTTVAFRGVARDGTLIAFGVRKGGEDETDIRLMDVDSGRILADALPRGRYMGFAIRPDKSGFYYSRFVMRQGSRVYYHAMGTPASADKEIFGTGYGPDQMVGVTQSENGRWLMFTVGMGVPPRKVEIYVQDAKTGGAVRPVVNDIEAAFRPSIRGDRIYLWTNWNAPNWRVLAADLENPARERWKEVVPEGRFPIDEFSAAAGRLFASYLENVVTRVRQFDADGKPLADVTLPGIGSATAPEGLWDGNEVFYTWNSFVEPPRVMRITAPSGRQDLWFQTRVAADTRAIEVRQVWYRSKDGTRIPMFVLHRKGIPLDGQRPTVLYGYGGFASSATPAFSPRVLAWTAMGGVYAIANLRGGGEFGERWHRAGMFEKKQNVFDDFIAAAEWLVREKYTNPRKLGIMGGSNGGLLVGAAMTQRPELFGAVVCGAPLLDMLRYQKFKVGSWWAAEYGSADDPKQFEYLRRYSPYHNVRKGEKYPAVLFVTGDSDTRVDPLHARKMTALVQAAMASDRPVLLRYDTSGGHTSGVSVDRTVEEQADQLAFLAAELGLQAR